MTARLFCGIPARGGSERLPRKNVLPLAGRPMLGYTIAAALESGCFEGVYVCTDDDEIAGVARGCGAAVPELLPPEQAGPLVASHRACQWLWERLGSPGDVLVCLQPSSPLRSAADIRGALAEFDARGHDSLVSVTPIDPHYYHWAVAAQGQGFELCFGERFMIERPLLPPVFRPNGAIKIARFAALQRAGHFFRAPFAVFEMPEERSVHVATRLELMLCEAILAAGRA